MFKVLNSENNIKRLFFWFLSSHVSATFEVCVIRIESKMEATQASKRIRLSSRDEVTINDLPNELIIEIVKHMNASSLLSFSGTCKRFFSVCQSSRYYHIVIIGSLPY